MGNIEDDFAEQTTGVKKPRSFILDSSVLQNQEDFEAIKEEIKQHRVIFEFPGGINDIDLLSRCRMLCSTDNFDLCYETVLEMLEGKPVKISLKNYDNATTSFFAEFQIVNKEMDLKAIPALNEYPIIVNWLVEFIVGLELKKFPLPLRSFTANETEAEEKKKKLKKKKKSTL
jgi:hypothetical protein